MNEQGKHTGKSKYEGPYSAVCQEWAAHIKARAEGYPFEAIPEVTPEDRMEPKAYQEWLRERFPRLQAQDREWLMRYAPLPRGEKWDPSALSHEQTVMVAVELAILTIGRTAGVMYSEDCRIIRGDNRETLDETAQRAGQNSAKTLRTLALRAWVGERGLLRCFELEQMAAFRLLGADNRTVARIAAGRLGHIERLATRLSQTTDKWRYLSIERLAEAS